MTAREIIHGFRQLPAAERAEVLDFIHAMESGQQLSPRALKALGEELAGEADPSEAARLGREISSGFYGRIGTGRTLAEILSAVELTDAEAASWNRDLQHARNFPKPSHNRWA